MYFLFIFISITIFICLGSYAYINRKKHTKATSIALVGVMIATAFLVFPLYKEIDFITNLLKTVIYAIKMPSINSDFSVLNNAPNSLFKIYEYVLYIYCVCAPTLAAGVILSFINSLIDEFISNRQTKKNVHIFSFINEKSLILAESIYSDNNLIIFKDNGIVDRDRIKKINGIILKKNIENIRFDKYLNKVYIYQIDDDEEKNLNETLSLIDKVKNKYKNLEIYVFSKNNEARIILDSTNKYNVRTTIISETEQLVYNVLDSNPLYLGASDKNINALIIGCGIVGRDFLKSITWCGQMIDYKLKINVIDKNANDIKSEIDLECPELISNYNINFYDKNVKYIDTYKLITEKMKDTSYIVINLGSDILNLETAINLRREFLRIGKMPIINLLIEDDYRLKQIKVLKNEKGNEYNLYPYGSIKELYNFKTIINRNVEEIAKKVHLAYSPDDTKFNNYYKIEYNKKSSRSTALHIKYKLYSILGDDYRNKNRIKEIFKDQNIIDKLAENEHNRWNAYVRSDGYRYVSTDEVKKYYSKTNNHIYHLAKLHPALVDFSKLDEVSEELTKIKNVQVNLKDSDYFIVESIPKIIDILDKK